MPSIIRQKVGSGPERRCDARCHKAKHSKCRCVCGGRYHGLGVAVKNCDEAEALATGRPLEEVVEETTQTLKQLGILTDEGPKTVDLLRHKNEEEVKESGETEKH